MPDVSLFQQQPISTQHIPKKSAKSGCFQHWSRELQIPNLLQNWDKNTWFVTGVFDRDKEESRKQELLSYEPIF